VAKKDRKIAITGGHLTPALAVIEELQQRGGWQILFFGRKHTAEGDQTPSMESQIIAEEEIPFVPIEAGRIQRRFTRHTIPALLKIPLGFIQAFYYLVKFHPDIILSFGGYVSVPVVVAGWILGIPSVTHEQTTVKGLATRLNSLFVKNIAVSWPQTVKEFPVGKVVLTGNPIRQDIFKVREKFWRTLDFYKDMPSVFITGGNQGFHLLNEIVNKVLPKLLQKTNLFHQCGHLDATGDFEKLEIAKQRLPVRLRGRYHVKKYLTTQEMGTFLNYADLIVCRAGANTITELAVLGKPALLIPIPYASEQIQNAQMLANAGIAQILPQNELSPESLVSSINKMLESIAFYQDNAAKAKKLVDLSASKKIVDLLGEVVE